MRRLAGAHEHLDGPLDAAALDGNLRDLARLNARLGGVDASRRALAALAAARPPDERSAPLEVLDVGTGGADIPVALLAEPRAPASLRVTATDARPEIVAWASREHGGRDGLTFDVADGMALPYPDGAFAIGHCSLVLHHIEPEAAGAFLGELARVSRLGVVINDLDRSWHGWAGAWLLLRLLARDPWTRHDGPLSVRRAYRPAEVATMASSHGLIELARHWAPARHRYAIAFRRDGASRP
jgi:ubiquinone/menaquinone biosynthesis C-methylase UbiE